ncbi:carbohydrate-binding domain-containing protein [Psychrobacillus sp. INOP01]|uniref:carbohydrate-binding domain-containing protein n=1 Tax=Psychrobacillus sp. INOP01 TaxID=2829187 RepID=UPI001BA460B1|nr:carbohydrate-binding domain-containing protein [Psychrobacillus sp. INOP01]QUG42748.1 carbohydrate-binding domain-containing protein [Psychrobacillus sp. INOP01]
MEKKIAIPLILSVVLIASGCNEKSSTETSVDTEALISQYVNYDSEDFYTAWEGDVFTKITLNDDATTFDGSGGVIINGQNVEIHTSGTYVLEGSLSDGQIKVNTEDTGNVRLILNGVEITSSTNATIDIEQSDKTIISLEKGTENILTDATSYVYEDEANQEVGAAIFSKDDLIINGTGMLTVNGHYKDGIVSRDDLIITGGTINVTAIDDGVVGRDVFALSNATVNITADGDGVKSSNDEDEDRGNIVLESGYLTVIAQGDGLQAEKEIIVIDGEHSIKTGDGSPEIVSSSESGMGMGMGSGTGNMPEMGAGMSMDFSSMTDDEVEAFVENMESMNFPIDISTEIEGMTTEEIREYLTKTLESMMPQGGGGMDRQNPEGSELPEDGQLPGVGADQNTPPEKPQNSDSKAPVERNTEEDNNANASNVDTTSQKGIKAGTNLNIVGGTITVDTMDDALHSNGDLTIQGGEETLSTGDDGIHADGNVFIAGGDITILKSLEGIEGTNIEISDGSIHLKAADDGVNVNGGSDMNEMFGGFDQTSTTTETEEIEEVDSTIEDGQLTISGGYLYVDADGDGLDSNTNITMTGGTAIVYGPTEMMNGTLDYDGTFIMQGGTLIASGSAGMPLGVSDGSTQNTIMMTFDETLEANTPVTVTNADGEQIITVAPEKNYQMIVISSPDLDLNEEMTLSHGGTLTGDVVDGVYTNATTTDPTGSVTYSPTAVMTYLNSSGMTEEGSSMMGGGMRDNMQGGGGFGRGQGRQQTETTEDATNE